MADRETIHTEVARIKQLRADYDALIMDINSHRTIEAYHKWYDESSVVFSHYFDDSCKEYSNFTSIDNNGNGYVLQDNYQKIRKDFCVLVDKLERGYWGVEKQITVASTQLSVPSFKKRIFISHASKDKELIGKFVDSIFLLGMGMNSETIAYTSREDTGVPAGESIPQFIQNNIACADIILLMISDNYKDSEVCLNEMGAAWALNKYIIQILLPNTSFDKLGWLCSLDKAIKINNSDNLDGLSEVLTDRLDISVKPSVWNRNKTDFIEYCTLLSSNKIPANIDYDIVKLDNSEELGFLDYKEKFDVDVAECIRICSIITEALEECTSGFEANTKKIHLNLKNPNITQIKEIMITTAGVMDNLSDIQENNTLLLKNSFFDIVDNAVKMKSTSIFIELNIDNVLSLLDSFREAKTGIISFKTEVDKLPKIEKTIILSKNRLSKNLDNLSIVLDECITKGKELISIVL